MVSCYLQGGLGNQLFQIATTLSYAWDNKTSPVFNLETHHLPLQGNKAKTYKDNLYKKLEHISLSELQKFKVYNEPNFSYTPLPKKKDNHNILLHGYFQSENYFVKNRDKILEYFKPSKEIVKHLEKYKNILNKKTCSIHIRRGDYLKLPNDHPIISKKYYENAIRTFDMDTKFLLFSDDISWCKDNLKLKNIIYIDGENDYIELYLMSLCDNNIIANSSFSWWGAWLNKNQNKKIIAPNVWFGENKKLETKDIIPKEWKKF